MTDLQRWLGMLYAPNAQVSLRAVHPDAFEAYAALAAQHDCTPEAARDLASAAPFRARSRVLHVANAERRIADWAHELPGHNLYMQVASVRLGARRGGLDTLECARALWVDMDASAGIYALDEIAAACEHARAPEPNMVVRTSELGWHCYWALAEPARLFGPIEQYTFRRVLYGLAARLGGDLRATDPARVLRPPDTLNHASLAKQREQRRAPEFPVQIVYFDHGTTPREALRPFAADPPPSVAVSDAPDYDARPYDGELPLRAALVLECDPDVRDRFEGLSVGLTDQSDSAIDLALARALTRFELEPWEIEHAVRYSRGAVRRAAKRQDDRHYVRIVNRVLAEDDGNS